MTRLFIAMLCALAAIGCAGQTEKKPAIPTHPLEALRFDVPDGEGIECVAFSPDGSKVLAGSFSGSVWLWDAATGQNHWKRGVTDGGLLTGAVLAVAYSPNGDRILLGCADCSVRLLDAADGSEIRRLEGARGPVWSVIFFNDGRRALSGSTSDHTIREWDLQTGKELRRFKGVERPDSLSLSPNEEMLLVPEFAEARRWNLRTSVKEERGLHEVSRVHPALYAHDGARIVTATSSGARIWDAATGKRLRHLAEGFWINSAAVSRAGDRLLLGGVTKLQLWDMNTGQQLMAVDDLQGSVYVAFSPDGRYALTGEDWGSVRLWRLPAAEPRM